MALKQLPELERALQLAHDRKASNVYLVPGEPTCLRIQGRIERSEGEVLSPDLARRIAEAAIGQERLQAQIASIGRVHTSVQLPGSISGQMYVTMASGQYTMAIHTVPGRLPDAAAIQVPPAVLDIAVGAQRGLIIFTGPTGSGKTTTALAVLDHVNASQQKVLCTVEDPISSSAMVPKRSMLIQREVGTDVPDTSAGIVACLMQGADVLLVGEMRNPAEVNAVVTAAHIRSLVLTQMHQRSTTGAIQRLIEVQPADTVAGFRRQLAEVLCCVVSQSLVLRADGAGHIAAYGVLIPDDPIRQAIAQGVPINEASSPLPSGCQTIEDDARRLATEGIITPESADQIIRDQKRVMP